MMRRLNTSTFLAAALFFAQPAFASSDTEKPVASTESSETAVSEASSSVASTGSVELLDALKGPIDETATPANSPEVSELLSESFAEPLKFQFSREEICQMIEEAASGEALPFEFLARLIWQESRFNPHAVSGAGAQGIAQFMPKTAAGRGLANPFEPAAALHESAEFLRELRDRFGNLGLAAAAYNAGPKRVQDWLAKRGALPRETQQYVHIITGHRPEAWAASAPQPAGSDMAFRCTEIAKMAAQRRSTATIEKLASLVAERMAQKSRAEASASQGRLDGKGRNATRNGIIGKRGTAKAEREQVAKVVVQSVKGRKIIKITAQGRQQPRIERVTKIMVESDKKSRGEHARGEKNVKVAAATRNAARSVKVAQATSSRRDAKDAGKTSAVSAQKKKGPVRVATNARGADSKSCSAKGARKSCRAA